MGHVSWAPACRPGVALHFGGDSGGNRHKYVEEWPGGKINLQKQMFILSEIGNLRVLSNNTTKGTKKQMVDALWPITTLIDDQQTKDPYVFF